MDVDDNDDDDDDDDDHDDDDDNPASAAFEKEEESNKEDSNSCCSDDDDDDGDSNSPIRQMVIRRRNRRANQQQQPPQQQPQTSSSSSQRRRSSSRSTRFTSSMKEPPSDSVRDLLFATPQQQQRQRQKQRQQRDTSRSQEDASSESESGDDDDDDPVDLPANHRPTHPPRRRRGGGGGRSHRRSTQKASSSSSSPILKSPARRHNRARRNLKEVDTSDEEDDQYSDSEGGAEHDDDNEMKIQRILASRTETKREWRRICQSMNGSEVTEGSRWFQDDHNHSNNDNDNDNDNDDKIIEERFLVKWSDLSYLHVSWETQDDLLEQVEGAKTYFSTFFRKAQHGLLFSSDDRNDGDYFDPGFVTIDRILDISFESSSSSSSSRGGDDQDQDQNSHNHNQFGICLDKHSPHFEDGTGRQFLIKWTSQNYSESTFEFERDLILADIEYQPSLLAFQERTHKPTKATLKKQTRLADEALRRAYKLFGDKMIQINNIESDDSTRRNTKVQEYQTQLSQVVFQNGGQLRDYQAEGISWFLNNYVNQRSCILADEMGLGKTLQTAAFVHLLTEKMHRLGPFLIVVPLSTLSHWHREFVGWTGLNTIVYHGSAEDRRTIREHEFAFPTDRPDDSIGANALYLNKCEGHHHHRNHKGGSTTTPWMTKVVVTTPEMLVAEDWAELAAVSWEVLVVDEAHRLKNHNSKLAVNLRKEQFKFKHKILLTGTPIQNDIKEFWTLLNFIDPDGFDDLDDFLDKYGDIKSKDRIDELHETIRPYILRRLKEDVEKSVPPKEETLIEVELTLLQKQYYRALYEKNVGFLHKNKKKALDGPSLNNLAMQLRKCCNHLFLLNGVEDDERAKWKPTADDETLSESDFLARGSGKLVLLDKLLPRLKENGHRILLFSQFKIMLDILEDYLLAREMKFERIDGSITGQKRQQAIDRFQDASNKDPPFIMLLSTRAGGVGINLTSADTCIIFDRYVRFCVCVRGREYSGRAGISN